MKVHGAIALRLHKLLHQWVGAVAYFSRAALRRDAAIGQDDDLVGDGKGFV